MLLNDKQFKSFFLLRFPSLCLCLDLLIYLLPSKALTVLPLRILSQTLSHCVYLIITLLFLMLQEPYPTIPQHRYVISPL
ncbi:hypothetical protein I79_026094 [Cricetulus griseus]|uniref:Uncharacterized protein n=1 Tax=Cricetulus griseus TaxID=10029 RepID=G3IQ09_CRIGR|nr:hypothetical protein I79_026094 [Cricetulus griseus]